MKKLLLSLTLVCLISCAGFAQFAIQGGLTSASQKAKFGDEDITSDAKLGFTIGVAYRLALGNLSLQPELNFTQKGGKEEEGDYSIEQTLSYIEVPIYLMYVAASKKEAANNAGFFAGLGPAFAFGMGGKWKEDDAGNETEGDINFGSGDDDDYKPLDISANLMAGYMLSNGLYFSAIYSMGLSSILNDDSDEYSIKNRYIGFRIGFMLGAMKGKGTTPN